jgi:hypothetical protein
MMFEVRRFSNLQFPASVLLAKHLLDLHKHALPDRRAGFLPRWQRGDAGVGRVAQVDKGGVRGERAQVGCRSEEHAVEGEEVARGVFVGVGGGRHGGRGVGWYGWSCRL